MSYLKGDDNWVIMGWVNKTRHRSRKASNPPVTIGVLVILREIKQRTYKEFVSWPGIYWNDQRADKLIRKKTLYIVP